MKKWTLSLVLLLGAWLLPAQNTAMLFLPVNRDAATVGGAQALSSLYNPAAIPFTGAMSNCLTSGGHRRWHRPTT